MKTYWQLDARERLALTEEEIKTIYVPREVAEAGLLMPRKPMLLPVPPRPEIEPPTSRTVFKVKGFKKADSYGDEFDCAFSSLESAESFIKLKPMLTGNKYRSGSRPNTKYADECEKYEVSVESIVKEAEVDDYDKAMAEYNEVVSKNESLESTYNREVSAINSASKKIWDNWNKIKSRRAYLEQVMETLGEFLKVAEGNANMAIKFLMKKVEHQAIYDALNEISNDYVYDVDMFGGCLAQDANPYRDIEEEKSPF